jgi:hypothetical protein
VLPGPLVSLPSLSTAGRPVVCQAAAGPWRSSHQPALGPVLQRRPIQARHGRRANFDHLFASWVILERLIEMKHQRPARLAHVLPCRVGPPFESGVVVHVPASLLHRTVLPLPGEPIRCPYTVARGRRVQETPHSRCKECKARSGSPAIRERCEPGHRRRASLPGVSEIYWRSFGKGSLLQLVNATVVLDNGHGLSRAIQIICTGAEILIQQY